MTKIGDSTPPKMTGAERRDRSDRQIGDGAHPRKKEPGSDAARAALFQQKVLHAQKKGKQDGRLVEEGKTLLAMLLPTDSKTVPTAQHTPALSANDGVTMTGRVEWIETLYSQIEHAVLSAAPGTPDGIFTLGLQLAVEGKEGLRSVEISMSPTALDVVLSRTEGQATVEYLAATQALAERLQERFPRRIIRIHETAAGSRIARGAEPDAIAETNEKPEGRP
jgi:predicted nucleic acid-binding Zn ribbon protein